MPKINATRTRKALAAYVAKETCTAYSWDRYANWTATADALLAAGFTEREARGILRSKWTRWAADRMNRYDRIPAKAITAYVAEYQGADPVGFARELAELAASEPELSDLF